MTTIGIIGGSGLYELDKLENIQEEMIETPFGRPSDAFITGTYEGSRVIFVPRHGRGHTLLPHEVPYRANIWALKHLGAQWVISASAVGSMKESVVPGSILLPDQFIDRTQGRVQSFFGNGIVAHVSVADPVCPILKSSLAKAVNEVGVGCHDGGTYLCMQGPAFSTRGESMLYRQWNVDVIGMTAIPEVKLAREAELRYATMALVTDYDCWHEEEENVSADSVLAILRQNTANVHKILAQVIPQIAALADDATASSPADNALQHAIMTAPDKIPQSAKEALAPIIKKYFS